MWYEDCKCLAALILTVTNLPFMSDMLLWLPSAIAVFFIMDRKFSKFTPRFNKDKLRMTKRSWKRPSWDEYFLKVAMLVSERATCPRMHCGCVLVKDKQILSTGYNGSIPGDDHCEDAGCIIVDNHCVRTIHAEMNAILQCSSHGISTQGSTAYITNMPCTNCSKALITAGIKEIVIFSDYHDTLAEDFFRKAKVNIKRLPVPDKNIDYDLKSFSSAKTFK